MKKISGLFFLVLLLFSACKKEPVVPDSEPEPETVLAIGVWQNGNYFFSLNSEGFLTSYIATDFIDCGMVYNATNNEIICNNTYFVRNTSYKIKKIDSKKMDLEVNYKNVMGEELTQEIILYKSI